MIKSILFLALSILSVSSCVKNSSDYNQQENDKELVNNIDSILKPKYHTDPLYKFSITSNEIDFIKADDPDDFHSLSYVKQDRREMPDKRNDNLFDNNTYVFKAKFGDGKEIDIWCHSSFGSESNARSYAEKACPRLGKLPPIQRNMLHHIVIHKGDETAFAEKGFFILYSENIDTRINNNDFEETVFHESIHASLQTIYEESKEWKLAQDTDGNFITEYALSRPGLEDMPETAIFAYTIIKHPGRLSSEVETWVNDFIPNKLAFFKNIYEQE